MPMVPSVLGEAVVRGGLRWQRLSSGDLSASAAASITMGQLPRSGETAAVWGNCRGMWKLPRNVETDTVRWWAGLEAVGALCYPR